MNNFTNAYPGAATSDAVAHLLTDGVSLSVWLVLIVVVVLSLWKVFQKAGQAGWKSLIPVYNVVILCRMANLSGWFAPLMLVPILNVILPIIIYVRLAKAFGRSGWFALGLFFLSPLFLLVLAFDGSAYKGPYHGKGIVGENAGNPVDVTASVAPATAPVVPAAAAAPVASVVPEPAPEELHS